jgi:hypothetical protein
VRIRSSSKGVMVSAFLAVCLLAWTAPANAAGGGMGPDSGKQAPAPKGPDKAVVGNPVISGADLLFPPGFDDFTDTLYYGSKGKVSLSGQGTAMAGEPGGPSPLSLRLYGGYGRMTAADVNEGLDGYFELLELYAAFLGGTTTGGYKPLHTAYNFGADLVFQITPNIGVGIGAGYLQSSKSSLMTFSFEADEITLTASPKLSAMPIRLAVFLTLPLGEKFNLTADAGPTYYAGLKFDATQHLESSLGDWQDMSLNASRSSLSDNLGFQGSLGFEYKLSPRMGFFVEAVGRYASFKNFATATGIREWSGGGGADTAEGKIYIETFTEAGVGSYSLFTVEENTPTPEPPEITYREPKFDLGGFSLQAGIRIRF